MPIFEYRCSACGDGKVDGKQLVAPPSSEPPMVVNLLEALKASVAQAGDSGSRKAASKALARQLSGNGKPARKTGAKRAARRKTRKKKIA